MAIAENRITSEKLIQAENEGGDGLTSPPDLSDPSSFTPKGLIAQLPSSIGQYSSFKELTSAVQGISKMAQNAMNELFTVPNIDNILGSLGNNLTSGYNLNQNTVNTALGVVKAALCGDSDALVFDLSAIYRALDFNFDFLLSLNICGRQKMRNPIDTLLKGVENLEYQSKLMANLGPRLLNNLKSSTKLLIRSLNLPRSLETCLNQKAILQGSYGLNNGISLGRVKDLIRSIGADICKSSSSGVKSNNYTIKKVSAQPFISGIAEYDRVSMYSFYAGVLASKVLDQESLLEILSESFTDSENKNATKLLEMIAYTKITEVANNTNNPNTIGGINSVLQNSAGSADVVLENILEAAEASKIVKATDMTNVSGEYSEYSVKTVKFSAENILSVMSDDLVSESKDPSKDFNNTIKLLQIADNTFVPEDKASFIADCKTTSDLSVKGMRASTLPPLTSTKFDKGGNHYLRVTDDIELIHLVGSLSANSDVYETYSDAVNF